MSMKMSTTTPRPRARLSVALLGPVRLLAGRSRDIGPAGSRAAAPETATVQDATGTGSSRWRQKLWTGWRRLISSSSWAPASRTGPLNHLRAETRYQPPNSTRAPPTVSGA